MDYRRGPRAGSQTWKDCPKCGLSYCGRACDECATRANMARGYTRGLQEHLAQFVPAGDAACLAQEFTPRAEEGTTRYWPDLVAKAVRLRADHAVAGQPVTEASCARHEQVLAEALVIPVWGL